MFDFMVYEAYSSIYYNKPLACSALLHRPFSNLLPGRTTAASAHLPIYLPHLPPSKLHCSSIYSLIIQPPANDNDNTNNNTNTI